MTKRIFRGIVLTSLITFLACLGLMVGVLYQSFDQQLLHELKNQAHFAAKAVETMGQSYFEDLDSTNRITWVAADGTVLYDNDAAAATMENHANREEIKAAYDHGYGSSIRFSKTLSEKTVYYAVLLDDGSVIRISSTQATVWHQLLGMLEPMIFIALVVLVIAFLMAIAISKKIVKPINELDLEHPDIDDDYEEIFPLLHKIRRQNEQIEAHINNLHRQQKEFETITENMTEGFLLINSRAEILAFNSSVKQLLDSEEIEDGVSIFTLNRSEPFRTVVDDALAGRHNEQEMVNNGRVYHLLGNPVKVNGKLSGAVVVILDVTEKEKRKEMRREFSANVSHELKTPLTSIYGTSELMLNGLVKAEDMQPFIKSIHDESGRMITLIRDIIKLSQLDDYKISSEREPLDLYDAAAAVTARFQKIAEKHQITLTLEGEHAVIEGIPAIIEEIISNLLENAIKYNKEKGSVTLTVKDNDGHPSLSVKDTGIGIPKDDLHRIFERFYRVDKSHSKAIGGTGLGLSIVKHGAKIHNAEIDIKSIVGQGTEITIQF